MEDDPSFREDTLYEMPRPRKYPQELVDRGVRLAIESG